MFGEVLPDGMVVVNKWTFRWNPMSQKISGFPILSILSGEIWLECIQRPNPGVIWEHRRISPDFFKGASAYEVALANGFVGTVDEWLASLIPTISFSALNVGVVTTPKLELDINGRGLLPSKPYGDFILDMAHVYYADGSFVEVTGCTKEEFTGASFVKIPADDWLILKGDAVSIVVSYLGDLT